jgi:hypothetical protein
MAEGLGLDDLDDRSISIPSSRSGSFEKGIGIAEVGESFLVIAA